MRGYLIIGTALALAITSAMAGGKGGGGAHVSNQAQESISLNYGKVQHTYTQRDASTGQATGKRQHKPIKIIKEWGASSPQQ